MSKILIIDDDETLRLTLMSALQRKGFEVVQAASGTQGVQLARIELPAVILCDVEMQGVGGGLVLYAVRRDPKIASTPFILMSGHALSEIKLSGGERGADGFLAKPFSLEKLIANIDRCITRSKEACAGEEGEPAGEAGNFSNNGLLDSLRPVVEATKLISTTYDDLELKEIVRLATQAHRAASRLYQRIENSLPLTRTGT